MSFVDLAQPAGLAAFDEYIASKLYIQGYMPTSLDSQAFLLMKSAPDAKFSHALRYFNHMASFSDADRATFREGAGVPAQLSGSVKAPTVAFAAPGKSNNNNNNKGKEQQRSKVVPPADSASSADVAALEAEQTAQANKVRQMKADGASKEDVMAAVEVLKALKAKVAAAKGEPVEEPKKKGKKGKGGNNNNNNNNNQKEGGKGKKGKKDKKQDAAAAPAPKKPAGPAGFESYDAKLIKAVEKEGGKKGQDIIGVHEMGGLEFFCTTIDTPDGDLKLSKLCMDNMNKKLDPNAEEKRGGSDPVGKMLFSAGNKQLAIVAYVPEDKQAKVAADEWLKHVLAALGGELQQPSNKASALGVVAADMDKGRFTIKMKDEGIAAGVAYLRERGCFPDDDDDSGSSMVFGDDDFLLDDE